MKKFLSTFILGLTLIVSVCGLVSACGGGGNTSSFPIMPIQTVEAEPTPTVANTDGPPFKVAFLGDSLTAGFNAGYLDAPEDAHPVDRITAQLNGLITPNNLSLGGTSSGQHIEGIAPQSGIPYAQWLSNSQDKLLVIRYGGIEALFDLDLNEYKYNIEMMVTLAKQLNKEVVLVGKIYIPESEMANAAFQARYARVDTILRDVSARLQVHYLDVSQVSYNDGEMIDPIHPGKVYQDRVSDHIASELLRIFSQ